MSQTQAEKYKEQGIELFQQHDYEAAARAFQQAKDAYADADQEDMVAEMKVNLGLVHRSLGERQQALEIMQEALRLFEELGDDLRAAQVLGNIGGVYQVLDDKENAERSYRQAAQIFLDHDQEEFYADTMMALGSMQFREGNFFQAATTYQVALERKANPTGTQRILKSLSNIIYQIAGTPSLEETKQKQKQKEQDAASLEESTD